MKRNLLMLLFAMLIGVFTSKAQDVEFTIDIDNPESATVVVGNNPNGDPVDNLKIGENTVTGSGNVFVRPADGAEIVATVNGTDMQYSQGGFYFASITENMVVKITTTAAAPSTVDVTFFINGGSATVTSAGETTDITNNAKIGLEKGEYAVVTPQEGYVIDNINTYGSISDYKVNDDGTVSFMPVANGWFSFDVKLKGIDFTVETAIPSNIIVKAYGQNDADLGPLTLGYSSPCKVTAPSETTYIKFYPIEGGAISSIKWISSKGQMDLMELTGWRSSVSAGDTFVVEAIGPEAAIKFWGYDANWKDLDLSNFVVKVGDETISLSGTTADTQLRSGKVITVSATNGYNLKEYNAVSGGAVRAITSEGAEQTALITGVGDIFLQAVKSATPVYTIKVDDADALTVRDANNSVITLGNGDNTREKLDSPLKIVANEGYEITSVLLDGEAQTAAADGSYSVTLGEGATLTISTKEKTATTVSVKFMISPTDKSATVTSGGVTTVIANNVSINLKAGEYAVIKPVAGYSLVGAAPTLITDSKKNDDGTISFMPVEGGMMNVRTQEEVITFNVETAVPSNIIIVAYDSTNEAIGGVTLDEAKTPYQATVSANAAAINFYPVEGGDILSVKRISGGVEKNVPNSAYAGWRSYVSEGDTFVVEAVGPETTVKFYGFEYRVGAIDLKNFVVKVGENTLDLTGNTAEAKVRIGEVISVAAGKGYTLKESNAIYPVQTSAATLINAEGAEQTAMIKNAGDINLYALPVEGMIINIDDAAAVTVKGASGNGTAIELVNGENKLESVVNPLKIVANKDFSITSVVLNGEAVETTDGTYTAELLTGSTLTIKTKGQPKPFPLSVYATNGETSDLIITKDGEPVDLVAGAVPVIEGDEIVISAQLGNIIESVTANNGGVATEDEDTGAWTVVLGNGSMINVTFLKPAAGNALVGFSRDANDVQAWLFDKNGVRKSDPASLQAGKTIEVEIGDQIKFKWYKGRDINEILVNGKAIEPTFDSDGVSNLITIEGNTVIEVTTKEKEKFVEVTGYESLDVEGKSGMVIGSMFINEVGQLHANLRHGEKFYVIPTPAKGYKFVKFVSITGNLPVPTPVDGKYEFTVPESESVEYIMFRGEFVADAENPAYVIEGNSLYDDGEGTEKKLMGITRIDNGTADGALNVMAYAGETVKLLFFQNVKEFPAAQYYCENFCLYDDPEVIIAQNYVVNPDDARDGNKISIGAIVKAKSTGVENAVAENGISYDASSATIKSDKAVKVFAISGMLVKELPAGESTIEALPAGIYIVSNGIDTIKISR